MSEYGGVRSHYPESWRASASDFKDTAALRFHHSDVVFDLFIEHVFTFNCLLIQFFKAFLEFQVSLGQHNLIQCQKYLKFGLLILLLAGFSGVDVVREGALGPRLFKPTLH